jgi:hypothetical protein
MENALSLRRGERHGNLDGLQCAAFMSHDDSTREQTLALVGEEAICSDTANGARVGLFICDDLFDMLSHASNFFAEVFKKITHSDTPLSCYPMFLTQHYTRDGSMARGISPLFVMLFSKRVTCVSISRAPSRYCFRGAHHGHAQRTLRQSFLRAFW